MYIYIGSIGKCLFISFAFVDYLFAGVYPYKNVRRRVLIHIYVMKERVWKSWDDMSASLYVVRIRGRKGKRG